MDKAKLLGGGRIETETVTIPGTTETVTVRGLSRMEMLLAGKLDGPARMEPRILHYGMVDPELTEKEAEQWMQTSPAGELRPVMAAINRLSGMGQGADKEAAKSLPRAGKSGTV